MDYEIIDLQFLGLDHAIGTFLIRTQDGPVLIETGPYSTFQTLKSKLEIIGCKISDFKHVLLSHIHFDHAGGAWAFAKEGATIHLHPFGANHMHDPTKLVASATMIYGDQMDVLWGKMEKIEKEYLHTPDHLEVLKIGGEEFRALYTPGHAKHHIAWQWRDTIFTGDAAGVKIMNGPVVPPCPPPDISLEDWNNSIDLMKEQKSKRLVLTHYGEVSNVEEHLSDLKEILNDWAYFVKDKWESGLKNDKIVPLFVDYTTQQLRDRGVAENVIKKYDAANPAWMSVAGLVRYWKKKSES